MRNLNFKTLSASEMKNVKGGKSNCNMTCAVAAGSADYHTIGTGCGSSIAAAEKAVEDAYGHLFDDFEVHCFVVE